MHIRLSRLALTSVLIIAASAGAMAQSTSPATSTEQGFGAWISGHPLSDAAVILAIVVVIAGTYFMRQRSKA